MVSNASIAAMVISLVLSAGIPIAAAVWCSSKFKKTLRNILVGAVIFILFVLVLERSMHVYFLIVNFETSMFLDDPWIYAVYGAFAAGIFEETGRFLGFKFLLRGRERWEDGVAYGIGHGGIEAVLIGALAAAQNLYMSFMMNAGSLPEALEPYTGALTGTAPHLFLISGFERMFALALQVALSLLVLYGVKRKKFRYVIYAVLLHAAVDFPAALYQKGVISGILPIEAGLAAVAAMSLYFIFKSKKIFGKSENSVEGEI
ncbi:MAG: putative rane protein [Firmicutes bacterium]|nr:putative rane protein [Bacillota bacterium]